MKGDGTVARTRHTITVGDGTEIFFKDWGAGQPIVFSHGSPLNSDAWEDQMLFLADRGYRCIAHDRRGHGRSSQPWTGNDVDTYAADLAALVEELDLYDAVHVGHSTGAGEVVRYVARVGRSRVAKVVLVGAVTPLMVKTARNPGGLPIEAFTGMRAGVLADRSRFLKDLSVPYYGANRPDAKVSQAILDAFWLQGMQAGLPGILASIKAFSESDHTDDLKSDRRVDADPAWRRRSDRADRCVRDGVGDARERVRPSKCIRGFPTACARLTRIRSTRISWLLLGQRERRWGLRAARHSA